MRSVGTIVCVFSLLAQATLASEPRLIHVADVHFDLGTTYPSGQTPTGTYSYVAIANGTLNTTTGYVPAGYQAQEPLRARILPGGNDYALVRTDGSFGIDVTTAAQGINVNSLFHIASRGYIAPGLQLSGNLTTQYGELDAYQILTINTDSKEYGWLNAAALVAQERITAVNGEVRAIDLRAYRVVVKTS